MLRIANIKLPLNGTDETALDAALKKLRVPRAAVLSFHISKKSVDARDKGDVHFVVAVDVQLKNEQAVLKNVKPGIASLLPPAPSFPRALAPKGMRPVVAIYQTFLQRAWDQMLMDVCLQKLPVLFLTDRSGLGADDGPTHHGVFGLPALFSMPGLTILAPCCRVEMQQMIDAALAMNGPAVILYPRSEGEKAPAAASFAPGHWNTVRSGADGTLLAFSSMVETAVEAAERAEQRGVHLAVINASTLQPLDEATLKTLAGKPLYTLEESVLSGGFGSHVAGYCLKEKLPAPRLQMGIPDVFVPFGERKELLRRLELDAHSIAQKIVEDPKH